MHPLSDYATFILDQMDPDRRYEPRDLRVFIPDISVERLGEIMHELWINRQVERVGYLRLAASSVRATSSSSS